jgi:hypothetical protein
MHQREPEIDDDLTKLVSGFPLTAGGMPGEIDPNESHDWHGGFLLRAHSTDIIASVITFWSKDESNGIRIFEYTRTELLSDAEDALGTPNAPPTSSLNPLVTVQHSERSSPGITLKR